MDAADPNGEGLIGYENFMPVAVEIVQAVYQKVQDQRQGEADELRGLCAKFFDAYDKDGSGFLDTTEFRQGASLKQYTYHPNTNAYT